MAIKEEIKEIQNELDEIKNKGFAFEFIKDYKKQNKRQFIIILVILTMWFITIGYLVYVLNDIGSIETTITQDNANGYNNYIGNDGDINNG